MENHQISGKNQLFYSVAVGLIVGTEDFARAVIRSLFGTMQYSTDQTGVPGYILIKCPGIEGTNPEEKTRIDQDNFISTIHNDILQRISYIIYNSVEGEFCTNVTLIDSGYKFAFCITKYERDQEHMFELIESTEGLKQIPGDEKIGHYCELTITKEEE